ncbi:MAG: FapA family protein [Clostridia bacterium]|jgi:hypothetical protein|nr:FapA family protein [Clostridia bacterium]MDH7572481.1 FapA family protein [Clostridia bacterium]
MPLAWVEDGKVRVVHPPDGPYPVLVPADGVELLVNGVLREGPTPVKQEDAIELRPLVDQSPGSWRLEVAPNGHAAKLVVRPQVVYRREIPDLPPAAQLKIVPHTRELRSPPLTLEELLEELRRRGICYGVDWQACEQAARTEDGGEFTVARGTPPVPGEPARLEVFFSQAEKVPVEADPEEKVDFRRRFSFTSAAPGCVLARKIPPSPGRPGRDVYGAVLAPPEPPDFQLLPGPGVEISADGLEAVAIQAGRPYLQRLRKAVRLGILPVLEHPGDVDLRCGNVFFQGDVRIRGSVQEGMEVKATGRVEILGQVASATIEGGATVVVAGNVLSSAVVAGGNAAFFGEIRPRLENLHREVANIVAAMEQVTANPAFKTADLKAGIGPLLLLLLEKRFQRLPLLVQALDKSIKALPPEMLPEPLAPLLREMESHFIVSPLSVRELETLRDLREKIKEFLDQPYWHAPGDDADLVLRYALGSVLVATGNIRILGKGCYNCSVRAGKKVIVRGAYRGGEIRAGGDVAVGELGSPAGIETTVVLPASAAARIGLARENARVQIGSCTHRFDREETGVELRLDKEGRLSVRYQTALSPD